MQLLKSLKPSNWLPTFLLFAAVFVAANLWSTRNHPDGFAPDFTLIDLNNSVKTFDFKQNEKPVLLHFFATWCPICELENGSLISLSEDHEVIMVAMQSGTASEIREYKESHLLTMPIYNDEQGDVSKLYKVTGVPTSFIINAQGEITSSTIGYASEIGLRFRLWLSKLKDYV